jgi:hypothetical protein
LVGVGQALVWPVDVDMTGVLVEDGAGMFLVVDQQLVGAFGVDAADEPFRRAVRPGRARMDLDHVDALGADDGVEGIGEFGVPVADEEAERGGSVAQVREQVANPGWFRLRWGGWSPRAGVPVGASVRVGSGRVVPRFVVKRPWNVWLWVSRSVGDLFP